MTQLKDVAELLRLAPRFHAGDDGQSISSQLGEEALRFIADQVEPGWTTLEIGAGYSTVVFALAGARHIAVTRSRDEVGKVTSFCADHDVSTELVRFVVDDSDRALPSLGTGLSLDFALVDGAHAFPMPFLDWHYATRLLRTGGLVMVDDVEVWTGRVLRDFMKSEPGWARVADLCGGRTAVFRKERDRPLPEWSRQPYVVSRSDLSLAMRKYNVLAFPGASFPRLARDIVLRAGRMVLGLGRRLVNRAGTVLPRRRKP